MTTTTTTAPEMTAETLTAAGGSLWEKGSMRRVYFNDLSELYGLKADRYNTGNISSATLDGETISNSAARRIMVELSTAKLYYDLTAGTFQSRGLNENDHAVLTTVIRSRVAANV